MEANRQKSTRASLAGVKANDRRSSWRCAGAARAFYLCRRTFGGSTLLSTRIIFKRKSAPRSLRDTPLARIGLRIMAHRAA